VTTISTNSVLSRGSIRAFGTTFLIALSRLFSGIIILTNYGFPRGGTCGNNRAFSTTFLVVFIPVKFSTNFSRLFFVLLRRLLAFGFSFGLFFSTFRFTNLLAMRKGRRKKEDWRKSLAYIRYQTRVCLLEKSIRCTRMVGSERKYGSL
jgi:hypothetical protein